MDLNIKINKNNVFNFFTNNLEKIFEILNKTQIKNE